MVLRASKFFGLCYSDELLECEFFAKNFNVIIKRDTLVLSFNWVKGLDLEKITSKIELFTFFEIEDVYLKNKLSDFLKMNNDVKKLKLETKYFSCYIKNLKFNNKGFILQLR